jgi:hypothetical protein
VRADQLTVEERNQEIHLTIGVRRYRVRGLEKNLSGQQLRVNILATRDELVHMDTLDLCQARLRASFVKATATELFVEEATIKRDVGRMLLALEQLQQERIEAATTTREAKVELTEAEVEEALELLKDPNLTGRILADYAACGLVGEETNKLVCYLACVSRHLSQPLAVLIQSGSAAGKTSLMDATLHFMPPETQVRYSAMTGQSLYYMGRHDLKHKILAVAEEEGVAQASYALKLLQSDGRLRIAAAGKNSGTGRQETESYEIEGPVMMFLTSQSLPDAPRRRIARADRGDPRPAKGGLHARRSVGRRPALPNRPSASERPAALGTAAGDHPLGRAAPLSQRPDPHASGPCQVPGPDRFDYAPAPASKASEDSQCW